MHTKHDSDITYVYLHNGAVATFESVKVPAIPSSTASRLTVDGRSYSTLGTVVEDPRAKAAVWRDGDRPNRVLSDDNASYFELATAPAAQKFEGNELCQLTADGRVKLLMPMFGRVNDIHRNRVIQDGRPVSGYEGLVQKPLTVLRMTTSASHVALDDMVFAEHDPVFLSTDDFFVAHYEA